MEKRNNEATVYDVFISYRRDGGFPTAKHMFDLLRNAGYSVSFDLDTLRNGDFDTELLKRIDECKDFILILTPGAFDRCLDPQFDRSKDWMRLELARALEKNRNIIPIMLPGFEGYPDNLPSDIKDVSRKNGPQYSQGYFDDYIDNLKDKFMTSRPSKNLHPKEKEEDPSKFILRIHSDEDCRIERFGEIIGTARKGEYFPISLKKGKHRFSFIPLRDPDKRKDLEYEVKEVNAEDYLDIVFASVLNDAYNGIKNFFGYKEQEKDTESIDNSSKKNNPKEEVTGDPDASSNIESKEVSESKSDSPINQPMTKAADLGEALERKDEKILIGGDLATNVVKIMSLSNMKWKFARGSIGIAIMAILAMPFIALGGPMGIVAESLVLSVGGVGAVGIMGLTPTIVAVSIGVGAKNKNAVDILRTDYFLLKGEEGKIILVRK